MRGHVQVNAGMTGMSGMAGAARAAVPYVLFDAFSTARLAGAINGTLADAGGHPITGTAEQNTRVVVDTNSKISISGGVLQFASGATVNDALWYGAVARAAGTMLGVALTPADLNGKCSFGWDSAQSGAINDSLWATGGNLQFVANGAGNPTVGQYTATTPYRFVAVMRAAGIYWFAKGGVFDKWILLWVTDAGSGAGYPCLGAANTVTKYSADHLSVPVGTYVPAALANDTFQRANGAIGSTLATGPDGQVSQVLAWANQLGTWTVNTNKAKASVLDGTLNLAIATVDTGNADVFVAADLTRSAGSVGLVLRYVDSSNYLRASYDGTNAVFEQVVDGTPSTLRTGAVDPHSPMYVVLQGTTGRLFFGGYTSNNVGASFTVPETTSTKHGFYTTDTGNTIDNFTAWPRGTGGEHSALDAFFPG